MQRILITGSNRGLGLGLVKEYLRQDDSFIFATCRNPEDAFELKQLAAKHENRIMILKLDAADQNSIEDAAGVAGESVDGLDILINNAAMNPKSIQSFEGIDRATMMALFEVNSVAPLMIVRAFVQLLRRGRNPRIVNVSSQVGSMGWKRSGGSYAYAASKAALNMVTRCLAGDLRGDGITTITLHPGWVQTDMGGAGASLAIDESVGAIRNLIAGLTPEDNGQFFKWNGEPHPW